MAFYKHHKPSYVGSAPRRKVRGDPQLDGRWAGEHEDILLAAAWWARIDQVGVDPEGGRCDLGG